MKVSENKIIGTYVEISGRGYGLEISSEPEEDCFIAVTRLNWLNGRTGITVLFSNYMEGNGKLPGCKRRTVIIQPKKSKQVSLGPSSPARLGFTYEVLEQILHALASPVLWKISGCQLSEDWFLIRFGWIACTGSVIVLAICSQVNTTRTYASQDVNIVSFPLRQSRSSQNDKETGLLERLISICIMRPLVGGRVAESLPMGRTNEKKTE